MSSAGLQVPASTKLRRRAKKACRACNARRVRCDVMVTRPCHNCATAQIDCEVMESRRGKYGRATRPETSADPVSPRLSEDRGPIFSIGESEEFVAMAAETDMEDRSRAVSSPQSQRVGFAATGDFGTTTSNHMLETPESTISHSAGQRQEDDSAVFLGESTSLRYVHETPGSREASHPAPQSDARLRYPITDAMKTRTLTPVSETSRKAARIATLTAEGAFMIPEPPVCDALLRAYFQWFHPCFPVVDRAALIDCYQSKTTSPLLLQSILFIGVIHCDEDTLREVGLGDRHEARYLFYNRAKDIYDADYEINKLTVLQALFMLSFWRAGPLLEKDTRHWLGTAISLAQTKGMHRSSWSLSSNQLRIRKKIWWSLYVRDRQCSAALGLPNRIRDEDCDIEPLEISDFDEEITQSSSEVFGTQTMEHVHYAIEMVKLARLLGKIVLTEFLPSTGQNGLDRSRLREELVDWESKLPATMSSQGPIDNRPRIYANMLHIAYNNLYILLYRSLYLRTKQGKVDDDGLVASQAACRTTRIVEDMLSQGLVGHGQVHLITSLFNSLCIHTIDIGRSRGTARNVAEHRAKLCLLGLKELQKTWEVTNWVLQLFFQFLDHSIAKRLQVMEDDDVPGLGSSSTSASGHRHQGGGSQSSALAPSSSTSNMTWIDLFASGRPFLQNGSSSVDQTSSSQFYSSKDAEDFFMYQPQPDFFYAGGIGDVAGDYDKQSLPHLTGVRPSDLDYLAMCL